MHLNASLNPIQCLLCAHLHRCSTWLQEEIPSTSVDHWQRAQGASRLESCVSFSWNIAAHLISLRHSYRCWCFQDEDEERSRSCFLAGQAWCLLFCCWAGVAFQPAAPRENLLSWRRSTCLQILHLLLRLLLFYFVTVSMTMVKRVWLERIKR